MTNPSTAWPGGRSADPTTACNDQRRQRSTLLRWKTSPGNKSTCPPSPKCQGSSSHEEVLAQEPPLSAPLMSKTGWQPVVVEWVPHLVEELLIDIPHTITPQNPVELSVLAGKSIDVACCPGKSHLGEVVEDLPCHVMPRCHKNGHQCLQTVCLPSCGGR